MTAKRWLIMFMCIAMLIAAAVAALNVCADPFGVFGDRLFNWYSADMTNNPKAAKYAYIDARRGQFDAFIVGPSGAGGFSPATLEKYTGLRWYNMFNYGADMSYTKRLAEYLLRADSPKQILLCVPLVTATTYDPPITDIAYYQPLKPMWRLPFFFANPKYSADKLSNFRKKSLIQQAFDVFDPQTGMYDKSRRDAEAIGDLNDYLAANLDFAGIKTQTVGLWKTDETVAGVAEVAAACKRAGTKLTVVTCPMLFQEWNNYSVKDRVNFYEKLAAVTDFWDFSLSSLGGDPRYFYDTTHFRNSTGDMMLARIFGDSSVYMPDDLGVLVTPANAAATAEAAPAALTAPDYTKNIPVITYHNIAESGDPSVTVSPAEFAEQMRALRGAGYTAVSLDDLRAYVNTGAGLPARPVVITFDDGYMSNYEYAFPVLRQYGFKAAIFVIGVSFGKDAYKDSARPMIPHFGAKEAAEMAQSGLITIQSHSYDMHQLAPYDANPRKGILRNPGESEADYAAALRSDYAKNAALIKSAAGADTFAFAYPFGHHDTLSSILLRQLGAELTFTSDPGVNTVIKGLPQSLYGLKRLTVTGGTTGDGLLKMIRGG